MSINRQGSRAYLVGGGIASLAAAVYLIKDGRMKGKNITIFEESGDLGGSFDGRGSPETGYLTRGLRMFQEDIYNCSFDLFSKIPLNEKTKKTLLADFKEFNRKNKIYAKARLVKNGRIIDSSKPGLSLEDSASLAEIIALPESHLKNTKISDHFSPDFFKTNFWFLWRTTFAFQPWHGAVEFKRYISRFIQEFPQMHTMTGVRFTRFNQYDSIIAPVTGWLKKNRVNFLVNSRVSALKFAKDGEIERVEKITYHPRNGKKTIGLTADDLVFLTNGSMTTNSALGSMVRPPLLNRKAPRDSWALWQDIAKSRPRFGRPKIFNGRIDKTKWESFTVTFKDKIFLKLMEKFSGNKAGSGGLTTIIDSNWILTLVTPPQPHFKNQPAGINVSWGYGLSPDKPGNFVHKKMSECSGREIIIELCSHLGFTENLPEILKTAICLPCLMPYITSQFMPRSAGDRPSVIPDNTKNFAFLGQYCEIPSEIVFTVEQSVRSAVTAVYGLLKIKKTVPPIYHGLRDPRVIKKLLKLGFDFGLRTLKSRPK